MDNNYRGSYSKIRIVTDETNGLVDLSLTGRLGQDRKTKIVNNFVGLLSSADPQNFEKICMLLNEKLPPKTDDEIIIGIPSSGVPMAVMLAHVRGVRFNWAHHKKYTNYTDAVHFYEGHRENTKIRIFYGLKPGDTVLLIDDEVTSGQGFCQTFEELRKRNITVASMCCVVEQMTFGARQIIKKKTGMDLVSLVQVELE